MSELPTGIEHTTRPGSARGRPNRLVLVFGPLFTVIVPMYAVVRAGIVIGVGVTAGLFIGAGHLFQRWAPSLDPVAMTCLVTWVWMYHLVEILRGRQPLGRGIVRAAMYAALMIVVVVACAAVIR